MFLLTAHMNNDYDHHNFIYFATCFQEQYSKLCRKTGAKLVQHFIKIKHNALYWFYETTWCTLFFSLSQLICHKSLNLFLYYNFGCHELRLLQHLSLLLLLLILLPARGFFFLTNNVMYFSLCSYAVSVTVLKFALSVLTWWQAELNLTELLQILLLRYIFWFHSGKRLQRIRSTLGI
jgi:hypothetical protein